MKMIKIVLIMVLIANIAYSENSTLKGNVIDKSTNKVLPGANIALHKKTDSNLVDGKISDKNGNFEFENIKSGEYFLKISYVGYNRSYIDFSLDAGTKSKDFGSISLAQSSEMTESIVVEAEKPTIQFSGGKTIINIDKDIVNSNGSALDVLKNTPSLEVNADGQVKLRGSTNFRILVDGKRAGGDASDPATILKQIPASALENIEIITNPSAKYEAEGSGGIINLIGKRKKDDGFNGLVSGSAGSEDRYSTSLCLNYKYNFFNLFSNYDYQREINTLNQLLNRDLYSTDLTQELKLDNDIRQKFNFHSLKLGSDFFLDNTNKLTLYGNYKTVSQSQHSNSVYSNFENTVQTENINRIMKVAQPNSSSDLVVNYVKNFEEKGAALSVDGCISNWEMDMESLFNMKKFIVPGYPEHPFISNQKTSSDAGIHYYSLQSDFAYPFSESSKIETGLKAELNSVDINYKLYNSPYPAGGWLIDSTYSVIFKNSEDIYSAYIQWADKITGFEYMVGIRSEMTFHNSSIQQTSYVDKSDYLSIFPSASFSYAIDESNQVQLSYSRRISRPQAFAYNPSKQIKDAFNIVVGNPALKPEYTESYDLGYILFFGKHQFNPAIFYKFAKDNIFMSTTISQQENLMYMTYSNDSDGEYIGTDLNYHGQLAEGLNLNLNFSYYMQNQYVHKGTAKYTIGEYTWDGRFSVSYYLLQNLIMQASGAFYPDIVTPLGRRYGYKYIDLAVKYDFWDKNASLTFRTVDMFGSLHYGDIAKEREYSFDNNYYPDSRHFSIGFSYKINNFQRKNDKKGNVTQAPTGGEMI